MTATAAAQCAGSVTAYCALTADCSPQPVPPRAGNLSGWPSAPRRSGSSASTARAMVRSRMDPRLPVESRSRRTWPRQMADGVLERVGEIRAARCRPRRRSDPWALRNRPESDAGGGMQRRPGTRAGDPRRMATPGEAHRDSFIRVGQSVGAGARGKQG